jgi:hypothetical protein
VRATGPAAVPAWRFAPTAAPVDNLLRRFDVDALRRGVFADLLRRFDVDALRRDVFADLLRRFDVDSLRRDVFGEPRVAAVPTRRNGRVPSSS